MIKSIGVFFKNFVSLFQESGEDEINRLQREQLIAYDTIVNIQKDRLTMLERDNKILKLIIKYGNVPIAIFDNKLHFLSASDTFIEEFGLAQTNETIIGRYIWDIFQDVKSQHPEVQDFYNQCLEGNVVVSKEPSDYTYNGKKLKFTWKLMPVFINSKVEAIIFVFKTV